MHEFYDYKNKFQGMSKVDVQVFFWNPPPKIEFFNTHTLKTTVFIGDILEFSVILRSGLRIFFLHVLRHCEYNQYQIRKYYQ